MLNYIVGNITPFRTEKETELKLDFSEYFQKNKKDTLPLTKWRLVESSKGNLKVKKIVSTI